MSGSTHEMEMVEKFPSDDPNARGVIITGESAFFTDNINGIIKESDKEISLHFKDPIVTHNGKIFKITLTMCPEDCSSTFIDLVACVRKNNAYVFPNVKH